jgi:hypothetical protein
MENSMPLPSWDNNLPSASRFTLLPQFNNEAVLDNNTGLVWEQRPTSDANNWDRVRLDCANKNVGGQKGWRLPAVAELASLIDPSVPSPGPTLPPGHPFLNVVSAFYWSASTNAFNPAHAWIVSFFNGTVLTSDKVALDIHVWCVRGPFQESVY